jgi:hypothetical protein
MTPRTRLRDCDDEIVSGRLNKAEQFLEVAAMARDLADDEEDVGALLQMKTRAGYGAPPVTADQRKRAFRRAEALVATAKSRHVS